MVLVVCTSVAAISISGCAGVPTAAETRAEARELEKARLTREVVENKLNELETQGEAPEEQAQSALNDLKAQRILAQFVVKVKEAEKNYQDAFAKQTQPADEKAQAALVDLEKKLEEAETLYQREVTRVRMWHERAELKAQRDLANSNAKLLNVKKDYQCELAKLQDELEQDRAKEQSALDKVYKGIGEDLYDVEKAVSKWGRVSISEIALLPNKGQFNLDYSIPTKDYVVRARQGVGASSSSSDIQSRTVSLDLQGTLQPPAVSAVSSSSHATNATSSPAAPTSGSGGQAPAGSASNQAKSTTASSDGSTTGGAPTQAGGKSPSAPVPNNLTVSERTAMTTGLNDKLAEIVLNQIANPSGDLDDPDNMILFGVFQVTCQPGSETWKNYIAEVDVSLQYARDQPLDPLSGGMELSRKWGNSAYSAPAILAVLPLMNSQSMDLSATQSNQTELAMTLAGIFAANPGASAQAKLLMDYIEQQNAQMKSLTAVPTVTTFTDGGNFGFQIYPAFQAMEDPASTRASSANVLLPICFPAVVILRVDKDDVADDTDPWKYVKTDVHTRWILTRSNWFYDHPIWTNVLTVGGIFGKPEFPPSFADRIALNNRLDDASERLAMLQAAYRTGPYRDAARSLPSLTAAERGISNTSLMHLPAEFLKESDVEHSAQAEASVPPPSGRLTIKGGTCSDCKQATPALTGFVNAPTVITVMLELAENNFKFASMGGRPVVKMVTLDGCQCDYVVLGPYTLQVTVPAGSFDDSKSDTTPQHLLTVTTKGGSLAKPVNIKFIRKIAEPVSNPSDIGYKPTVTITRDSQEKVTGITVDAGKPSKASELAYAAKAAEDDATAKHAAADKAHADAKPLDDAAANADTVATSADELAAKSPTAANKNDAAAKHKVAEKAHADAKAPDDAAARADAAAKAADDAASYLGAAAKAAGSESGLGNDMDTKTLFDNAKDILSAIDAPAAAAKDNTATNSKDNTAQPSAPTTPATVKGAKPAAGPAPAGPQTTVTTIEQTTTTTTSPTGGAEAGTTTPGPGKKK
jgi:hypothetical protein